MFPPPPSTTYPLDGTEFDHPPPSTNTTPLTPLPSWNTIPGANVVRGAAVVALDPPVTSNPAPIAPPNLPSLQATEPPAQLGFIEDEELEQQIEAEKQKRDAALRQLAQVEAQEAANKKAANKTITRRQPGSKVKTQSKPKSTKGKASEKGGFIKEGQGIRIYCPAPRNPRSDVPADAPARSTRSQTARGSGPMGERFGDLTLQAAERGVSIEEEMERQRERERRREERKAHQEAQKWKKGRK
ncbi:hypothetical protein OEA41_009988 [Lepraria neglecta]|uniref:Uncharacterized protein n=1 Tax=Lepraria neglecta TaxID=209136 RepID=A0AAD9YY64_9LECA|nr:hypothetical protein OEA41_009988 [Lepraria neglecta]